MRSRVKCGNFELRHYHGVEPWASNNPTRHRVGRRGHGLRPRHQKEKDDLVAKHQPVMNSV